MTSQSVRTGHRGALLVTWLFLLGLTAGSFWIADVRAAPGASTTMWVLGIAALKAHLVAGIFMEMLSAPRAWGVVMSAFLVGQTVLLIVLSS